MDGLSQRKGQSGDIDGSGPVYSGVGVCDDQVAALAVIGEKLLLRWVAVVALGQLVSLGTVACDIPKWFLPRFFSFLPQLPL